MCSTKQFWLAMSIMGLSVDDIQRLNLDQNAFSLKALMAAINGKKIKPAWRDIDKATQSTEQLAAHHSINILDYGHPQYPDSLRDIPDAPAVLFAQGNLALLRRKQIAVVGSRKITPYAKAVTTQFSKAWSKEGFVITSGFAYGVDATAHKAALDANGHTIAVMPCGLLHCYPRQHESLRAQLLASNNLLVSEYLPDIRVKKYHFHARNRLISGLSEVVVVTQAFGKSGTLITANVAADQGRPVWVVPGHVQSEAYLGSHQLIQSGANLLQAPEDIGITNSVCVTDDLAIAQSSAQPSSKISGAHTQTNLSPVLKVVRAHGTVDLETLHDALPSYSLEQLQSELMTFVLAGDLIEQMGNYHYVGSIN